MKSMGNIPIKAALSMKNISEEAEPGKMAKTGNAKAPVSNKITKSKVSCNANLVSQVYHSGLKQELSNSEGHHSSVEKIIGKSKIGIQNLYSKLMQKR